MTREPPPHDVVLSLVSDTYTDAVRRGFYSTADQTMCSLLESPSIRSLLVSDHPRGVLSQLYRRVRGDGPARPHGKLRGARPWALRTSAPVDGEKLQRRYWWYEAQNRLWARRHGLVEPIALTFNLHHAAALSLRPTAAKSIFYAQDDETQMTDDPHVRRARERAYGLIARGGMSVVAVSRELLDRIGPVGSGVVIPNGVDPELWASAPPLPRVDRTPHAFYAGTVDERLDVTAIISIARSGLPVHIAGPVRHEPTGRELRAEPGVRLIGMRSRAEVVALAKSASVCLLAHRDTPLTNAMSPLKLFEYVASGTPVVATTLRGSVENDVLGRVRWVAHGSDYLPAVAAALRDDRMPEDARLLAVEKLSWRRRHASLITLIGDTARRGGT